jgi:hypothetical protein
MLVFPALRVLQWAPAAKPGSRVTAQDPPQPVPSHHHPHPSQSLANLPKGSMMQSMQVLSWVLQVNGENAHRQTAHISPSALPLPYTRHPACRQPPKAMHDIP